MKIEKKTDIENAILGGAFFGGGGGGFIPLARRLGSEILRTGAPRIISPDKLDPDALVATVSFLGAPAAPGTRVTPKDQKTCLDLFEKHLGEKIEAFISCENGAISTLNGWLLSAATGKPVLDAPADGRAHPTGAMGSLGLKKKKHYKTIQAYVGGDPKMGKHIEGVLKGTVDATAPIVRAAASCSNGLIIVIRHPVKASYAIRNGAPGAIKNAIEAGNIIRKHKKSGGIKCIDSLMKTYGGKILGKKKIAAFRMKHQAGFDKGFASFSDGHKIYFLNEYMALDFKGKRVATFPDLICTFDPVFGIPLCSGELSKGKTVILAYVPGSKIKLGKGSKNPENLKLPEKILGIPFICYAKKTT